MNRLLVLMMEELTVKRSQQLLGTLVLSLSLPYPQQLANPLQLETDQLRHFSSTPVMFCSLAGILTLWQHEESLRKILQDHNLYDRLRYGSKHFDGV